MIDNCSVPQNIGIIMDGNGRWAEEKNLPRKEGHTRGIVNMINLAAQAFSLGAKNFVCYSLSTENLKREKGEVDHILDLVIKYFDEFVNVFKKLKIAAKFVGNLDLLPKETRESLKKTEAILSEFLPTGRTIYIAIAYGSQQEIVKTVNDAVKAGVTVTEESFLSNLSLPIELDLIIRTGGERRLSNFFLYQSSYAELYFSDKFFPDFTNEDLTAAFDWFSKRTRKYGLVK